MTSKTEIPIFFQSSHLIRYFNFLILTQNSGKQEYKLVHVKRFIFKNKTKQTTDGGFTSKG